jgi:hypothetical protein
MIKQISFCTLIICFLSTIVTGQNVEDFRFGLQISPSLSWMNTDDQRITNQSTALGLKLAFQAEFGFAEKYAIASGIGFHFNAGGTMQSAYGGRFFTESIPEGEPFNDPNNLTGNQVLLDYSIQYVEIPIGLKLRTREFGVLTYYLEAPIFTLGIRSNAQGSLSGGAIATEVEEIPIKPEVTPFALSWGFGGGVEYSILDGTRLFGGLTFQRLFTDVTKDGDDYVYQGRVATDDPKATINSMTLRLGVLF